MRDADAAMRRRIRQQVAVLGPRGVTSRVPDAIRTAIVAYVRRRQARGADWPTIADEVGFSVSAIKNWTRVVPTGSALQPVVVRPAAVMTLPAAGLAIVLPSGVRLEGLAVGDVAAVLAQLA